MDEKQLFLLPSTEIALRESWLEADPDIETPLVDYLAQQKLDVAKWRKLSPEDRSELLIDLKADYPGPGKWVAGWTAVLKNAAAAGRRGQASEAGRSTDVDMQDADQGTQNGRSYDTFVAALGANSEGINKRRAKGGIFTPRIETVHKILSRLQETLVLLLAATPCSGKTSICQLVYEEARKSRVYESEDVIYVNCAEVGSGGKSFEDVFLEQARVTFKEASKSPPCSPEKQLQRSAGDASSSSSQAPVPKKKLIILDEVQTTYDTDAPGHSLLWPLLKRLLASKQGGVNFLLSAARGSNPAAEGLPSTPWGFSDDQRIPLRPRPEHPMLADTNTPEPALQFTMDEYQQLFDSFCKSIGFGGDQQQLQTLYDIIEATTERHPGSVLHIMDLLKGRSPSNYAGRAAEWAAKEVEFVTSPRLLETLSGTRSFPTVSEFWKDKRALELISKLVASGGKETLGEIRKVDSDCGEKAEALAKSGYMLLEQNVVSFTSSLHMEFYRYNLTRRKWGTPKYMPGSIETFLAEALTKMHPPVLQNSQNLSTRGGVLGVVLEAHFQFELYSAITSLLPEGAYLSPSVGKIYGLEAYVDFVLHGTRKWALELLVDGRDLREHERRFEPNGRYHPMVLGKQIDAWIVVDLRNPKTGKPRRARGPGVCHVFFDPNYEKATIDFGNGKEQHVILTGRA